ncbi:hypothetical protein V1509DRAFT_635657 [Lipomyces kononenkoae]
MGKLPNPQRRSERGDQYYNHQYTYVNVNQAAKGGVNQGNLGCGSGCGGWDNRQCTSGNNRGTLWGHRTKIR